MTLSQYTKGRDCLTHEKERAHRLGQRGGRVRGRSWAWACLVMLGWVWVFEWAVWAGKVCVPDTPRLATGQ